ncbi:MAG: 50S ribosomal protein L4 [Bacillales bacterium]|nr:50S ribosomal protein L4 [Mollicutes bacterium]MCI7213866.1 50S ribosomal protein L4 [Bacillales bacterium]MDD7715735.1 50S ribosomal protein L4 [Mollicutes bacterium]MDY4935459.1 50S ribosomal protein L4 [Candidatus Enteromonas sp.]
MAEKTVSLKVINLKGEEAGTIKVSASVFGVKDANPQVIKDAVTVYQSNLRQATAKTKKRHEVHGTNKKPWRQKGTGRARAGDCKSPIWVGGGTVFGPDGNQNYKLSQNKKAHNLALRAVLSEKANNGLVVVDSLELEKASSKEFSLALKSMKVEGKTLVVVDGENDKLILSARNIANVGLTEVDNIAVYDVLNFKNIVVSKDGIKKIEEALK